MKMKLFLAVALSALLFSCEKKDTGENLIKLGVQVLNPTSDSTVVIYKTRNAVEKAQQDTLFIDTLKFDTANRVFLYKDYPEGYYTIQYERYRIPVFMVKGKPLNVQFDASNFRESVVFTGSLKKYNQFYKEHSEVTQNVMRFRSRMYGQYEDEFLAALDSTRKSLDTSLVELMTNKPSFNQSFYQNLGVDNYYLTARLIDGYAYYRSYYLDSLPALSPAFLEKQKALRLENPDALGNSYYTGYLEQWKNARASEWSELHPEAETEDYYAYQVHLIDSAFKDQEVKDFMHYLVQNQQISYYAPHYSDSLLQVFRQACTNEGMKASINEEVAKWEPLLAGKPAFGFSYPDSAGTEFSLEDFRGKVVYIDVWATWCGPCKQELPHLKKLVRAVDEEQVAIISISVDTDRDAWINDLNTHQFSWMQLYADGWSQITKDYLISGIPRFILIDQEGNIADANAKRPSGEILKDIEKLLKGSE